MDTFLPPIELSVLDLSQQNGASLDAVSFANHLFARLVIDSPADIDVRHPEVETDEVAWLLQKSSQEGPATVIATCPSTMFRAVLARIGAHFMEGQLYCGFASRVMRLGGHHARCFIYLGNCSDTGFWMKAYSRRENR